MINNWGERLYSFGVSALFPRHCVGCAEEVALLCSSCEQNWRSVPLHIEKHRQLYSFRYSDPLARKLICAWKYQFDQSAWSILEKKLETVRAVFQYYAGAAQLEAITYIPLHLMRVCERGFDQAEMIAKWMGECVGLPVLSLLERARYTKPQARLSKRYRHRFRKKDPFVYTGREKRGKGMRVLCIDDVWTTGSTMRAGLHILQERGFEPWVYTLAKG